MRLTSIMIALASVATVGRAQQPAPVRPAAGDCPLIVVDGQPSHRHAAIADPVHVSPLRRPSILWRASSIRPSWSWRTRRRSD